MFDYWATTEEGGTIKNEYDLLGAVFTLLDFATLYAKLWGDAMTARENGREKDAKAAFRRCKRSKDAHQAWADVLRFKFDEGGLRDCVADLKTEVDGRMRDAEQNPA